jgi:hypothetical protein
MNFLRKMAPFLGTALSLGGPLGAMAGSALTAALGAPTGSKVTDVLASLTKTPMTSEQMAAVQAAENDFQLQMKKLNIESVEELAKMEDDDRANARAMRTANPKDYTTEWLAFLITIGFFSTLWFVFVHGVRPESHDLAIGMVNVLGTAWVCVVAFYFGSSRGSANKDQIIGDIAKQP